MSKPVAWRVFRNNQWTYRASPNNSKEERAIWQPLFAHRQEWVGLTDEEVGMLTVFDGLHHVEVPLLAKFTRAIEAKLKEKNYE